MKAGLYLGNSACWPVSFSFQGGLGKLLVPLLLVVLLPVVLLLLVRAGLATPEGLAQKRKFAIVIAFVAAAILTPPDVVSQLLLAMPIIALYELSIFGAKILAPEPYDESAD